MRNGEKGQALPLAIAALAIGTMVITPFIGHASSSLIGSRIYSEVIAHHGASDAGVEHAIWGLTRGTLAEQVPNPGDEFTYQLEETLNDATTTVTVTANVTSSNTTAGAIADTVIDSLEFDTSDGYEPSMISISGDVYAIAYRGPGSDGFIKTISIASDGSIANTVIDTLEFDTANGFEPDIIHVSGDVYAVAYRGTSSDGFVKTMTIAASGSIGNTTIDTLEFDIADGWEPNIIHVSGEVYAVAYRGVASDGFIKTMTIAASGSIGNTTIDTLEFDTANGFEPDIIHVSGDVYAVAYRGTSSDGFVKTMTIAASGSISNTTIDTLEFDTADGAEPALINISGSVYAVVYRGAGNDGFLKTVSIAADGNIANSVIDTLEFATYVYDPSIISVADEVYAVAYRGSSNNGYLRTIGIAADGSITETQFDILAFDIAGYEPVITHVSGDIYAIAYDGVNNDGFVITAGINTQGGGSPSAAYRIVSTAGDSTIRAFVNIVSSNTTDNITIVSWQVD